MALIIILSKMIKKNNENNNFEVEKENEDIRGESELKDNNIGNNDDLDELENENLSIINKNENNYIWKLRYKRKWRRSSSKIRLV